MKLYTNTPAQRRPNGDNAISFVQRQRGFGKPASELPDRCPECAGETTLGLQTKLVVGAPDDPLEHEADRMAEKVMRMSAPAVQRQAIEDEEEEEELLQAKPLTRPMQNPGLRRQPVDEEEEEELLQPKSAGTSGRAIANVDAKAAPTSVHKVLGSSGQALSETTRGFFEPRFGHDFSQVRIHTGPQADKSAREVNAKAYTVGQRIVFAEGQFAPDTSAGRQLLAHELTHVLQQRSHRAPAVRRDVVADVREKLSYGLIDWAVTDEEATDSLALLSTIAPAKLPAELSRLGTKYVSRLLDNLPDAAKSGAAYQRVVSALGSSGVMDYATDQLSYGLFDWAVSSTEVARIFNLFANLPAPQKESFLIGLNKSKKLGRLLSKASFGQYTLHLVPWIKGITKGRLSQTQQSIFRKIVKHAPTSPIDILKAATEIRYDVTVGPSSLSGRKGIAWDGKKLRDTYLALDHLPDAHVARNKMLTRFGQFSEPSRKLSNGTKVTTTGVYSRGKKELASNVKEEGDISSTLIHETGHAVDAEMGWSKGPEPANPARGGWKEYSSHNSCATDMVGDSGGMIKTGLSATQRTDVVGEMAKAMTNRSAATLKRDIRAKSWFSGLAKNTQRSVLEDNALKAIPIGLQSPWFTATDGGEHLGDHVYQESYTPTWVRYRHEARKRLVAKYQFRDSGEWFAECYAAYYDPNNKVKGERLNKADPSTKVYFDTHVDTRRPTR